jgi:hypothetical protein
MLNQIPSKQQERAFPLGKTSYLGLIIHRRIIFGKRDERDCGDRQVRAH